MLGPLKPKHTWNWTASGKHPVARDYFRIGPNPPLLKAFSDWVKNGFQILDSKQDHTPQFYFWRFWARGPTKGNLVCGVGRDSSDSLGRPYPLLIMGAGLLEGWEDHWDLLPFAFEKTWRQMEYMATRRFTDFKQVEDEVCSIKPPEPNWLEFADQRESQKESEPSYSNSELSRDMENKASGLRERTEFFIPLDSGPPNDPFTLASPWHFFLKIHIGEVPNAVFMGGVPEEACLAVFKRPLVPRDFVRLWTIFSKGVLENGSFVTGKTAH